MNPLEAQGERARAYREASTEERCAMIRAHYDGLRAEKRARYESRYGPGSIERRQAELAALVLPPSCPGGYYGIGGDLSGSEYAAGGYQLGGRSRR